MADGNMYEKYGEVWTCGFLYMRAERQTDRQTDTLIAILRSHTVVTIKIKSRSKQLTSNIFFIQSQAHVTQALREVCKILSYYLTLAKCSYIHSVFYDCNV